MKHHGILVFLASLGALAGVLVWLALQADIQDVLAWLPAPPALVQQLVVTLVEWLFYSATVALLMQATHGSVTHSSGGFLLGIRIYFSCTALNYLLPLKPGIPLRLYLYRRMLQIPYATGTAILLLEVALVSGLPMLFAPLALWYLQVPMEIGGYIMLGILAAATLSALLVRRRPARRGLRFVSRLRQYLQHPFRRAPARMLICILLQPLALLMYALRLWLILLPFGAPIPLPALWAIAVVSITAGRLSMLPMGIGVSDLSIGLLLAQAGASPEATLAAVTLNRLWFSSIPLLVGLATAPALRAGTGMLSNEKA